MAQSEQGSFIDFRTAVLAGRPAIDAVLRRSEGLRSVDLSRITPEQVAAFANTYQGYAAEAFKSPSLLFRKVEAERVSQMDIFLQNAPVGSLITLSGRHGEQEKNKEAKELDGAHQKLYMMKSPQNLNDSAAAGSIVEAVGAGLNLRRWAQMTGKRVEVRTSENRRAAEVAVIVAAIAGGTLIPDERLNCLNYPRNRSDEELLRILGPDGSLAWDEKVVDEVCGKDTYSKITENMTEIVDTGSSDVMTVIFSHTQQTNAVDVLFGEKPTRLAELGMRACAVVSLESHRQRKSLLLPSGVHGKAA